MGGSGASKILREDGLPYTKKKSPTIGCFGRRKWASTPSIRTVVPGQGEGQRPEDADLNCIISSNERPSDEEDSDGYEVLGDGGTSAESDAAATAEEENDCLGSRQEANNEDVYTDYRRTVLDHQGGRKHSSTNTDPLQSDEENPTEFLDSDDYYAGEVTFPSDCENYANIPKPKISVSPLTIPSGHEKPVDVASGNNTACCSASLDLNETTGKEQDAQFSVKADPTGGTFHSQEIDLSGSIPQDAVTSEVTLCFLRENPHQYQDSINGTVISDIYHILPHRMTFNKEIVLRFPHRANLSLPFTNTQPCLRIRYKILYSPTSPSERPRWEEVYDGKEHIQCKKRQDIKAILTENEVCLMLTKFCSFVAVEEKIQTKYVSVRVYGQCVADDVVRVTVLLTAASQQYQNYSEKGKLLAEDHVCLVRDVMSIKIRVKEAGPDNNWCLSAKHKSEQKRHTHYLWNDRQI